MLGRLVMLAAVLVLTACSDDAPPEAVVVMEEPTAAATATTTGTAPSATPEPRISPPPPPPSPPAPEQITLAAVGDVILARSVGERVLSGGPGIVFAGVEPILREADIAVANLESAISDRGTPQPKSYTFRAPPATAAALSHIGIPTEASERQRRTACTNASPSAARSNAAHHGPTRRFYPAGG